MPREYKHSMDTVTLSENETGRNGVVSSAVQHALATVFVGVLFIVAISGLFAYCVSTEATIAFILAGSISIIGFEVFNLAGVGRFSLRITGALFTVLCVVVTWFIPVLRMGLYALINQVVSRLDNVFGAYVPLFPLAQDSGSPWPVFVLLGFVVAFVVWLLLTGRLIIAITFLTFSLCISASWLQTGWLPSGALALVAWFVAWRLILNNRYISLRSLGLATIAAVLLVGISSSVCSFYTPSSAVNSVRTAITEGIDNARYGSDTLAQGNLFKAPSMNEESQSRLQVTYAGTQDTDLHLNGFVGANYNNGEWKALDHTAYEGEWNGMYAWLKEQGMNPHIQRALFDDENSAQTGAQTTSATMTIDATAANRHYVYAPVELRSASGATFNDSLDGSLVADGIVGPSTYTLRFDDVNTSADIAVTPDWVAQGAAEAGSVDESSFSATESIYRSFVYEHYLDITDEQRTTVERLFFDPLTWTNQQPSSAAVMSRVRIMLSTLASYSEAPERYSGTKDFTSWFLEDVHQGNSAYFATAAVFALRDQGVPARYVEGYYVAHDAEYPQNDQGNEVMNLTSADAHAWVEVYLDGMGWSPLEVTPGFYTQPYQADNLIEVNQDFANGSTDDTEPAGALGGSANKDRRDADEDQAGRSFTVFDLVIVAVALLVVALIAFAVAEIIRKRRIAHLRRDCASDNQHVSVPALFKQLSLLCGAKGISFSEAHPLDSADEFSKALKNISKEEYNRSVGLMQKFAFGGVSLKPNEMRVVRSLNERIADALQMPQGAKAKLAWRYKYLR